MSTAHVNATVLAHLLVREPRGYKITVARDAEITPGHLHDLETGRNHGTNADLRARIATALGIDEAALTCWCDRPDNVCRNRPREEVAA